MLRSLLTEITFQNLDRLPVTHGINMMEELFKMIRCLDPYTTDVPYMLGIYKEIIQGILYNNIV